MTLLPLLTCCGVALFIAYWWYGRLLERWLGVDPNRTTPATQLDDGNDYCPAPAPVVLGGHFTAIAAAGPVVGPIIAGQQFGWLPALLWILIGAIFVGGAHDAGSLMASVRHRAQSITQVVREHLSPQAHLTFLLFVWLSLIYVIIAFADVTAGTFARLASFPMVVDGVPHTFTLSGGAVAIGAAAYLLLSIALGLTLRHTRIHWSVGLTVACVLLALVIAYAPTIASMGPAFLQTSADAGSTQTLHRRWDLTLIVYCFFASLVPMWVLLQPRGLIGAAFLYATLAFAIVGTLLGGWSAGSLSIRSPMLTDSVRDHPASVFPLLFITIACGACSGFHSIVASGTTSKQIRRESDIRPVAYGAMLLEAMVAVVALSCVMVMLPGTQTATPDVVFARGIGNFMSLTGIPIQFAILFGLLAFSSFVFDTLDVCTRLGRYVFQELTGLRGMWGGALATLITLAGPALYLSTSRPGAFRDFWIIFGTSNQLLAALTLVGVSVWFRRTGRPVWFAAVPALFMLATTATALAQNFRSFYASYTTKPLGQELPNMVVAVVLMLLGLFVVIEAARAWGRRSDPAAAV
jgi:carbon starvation protein